MANNSFIVLSRNSDFSKIRQEGRKFKAAPWLLVGYRKNDEDHMRWGWTISKRIGKAVLRNRFKRWSRECLRQIDGEFAELTKYDVNLVFLPPRDPLFYKTMNFRQFKAAVQNVKKRIPK